MVWPRPLRLHAIPYRCISGAAPVHRCVVITCTIIFIKQSIFIKTLYNVAQSTWRGPTGSRIQFVDYLYARNCPRGETQFDVYSHTVWWQLDHLEGNGEWRQKLCTKRRLKKEWSTRQHQRSGSIKMKTARYCWVQTHAVADKAPSRAYHTSNRGLPDNP